MQKLSVQPTEKGVKLYLDGQEIQNILEFNLKAETPNVFELTVKMNVELSRMPCSNQIGDNLSGNL